MADSELERLQKRCDELESDLCLAEDRVMSLESDLDSAEQARDDAENRLDTFDQILEDMRQYFLELAPKDQMPYLKQRIVDFVKERR